MQRVRAHPPRVSRQRGVMLIEALLGILIFSLGIMALIGLQAQSIRNSSEAKYRADASFLADQIIGRIWAGRYTAGNVFDPTPFQHRPGGAICAPTTWTQNVARLLPDAGAARQSIAIDRDITTNTAQVTVRMCWVSRTGQHTYTVSTRLGG
jgi:type IV pilus assembly protein PilV